MEIEPDQIPSTKELIPAVGSPEPGSKTRFKIKIKMPPASPVPSSNDKLGDGIEQPMKVCDFCGKKFSSGKAWGGHKRHHLKQLKEKNINKNHNSNNNTNSSRFNMGLGKLQAHQGEEKQEAINGLVKLNENSIKTIKAGDVRVSCGGKPTCCLCGKEFPSMNSLFGHMRFHPDRGWKGTKPPSYLEDKKDVHCSSSSTDSESTNDYLEVDNDQICYDGKKVSVDLMGSLELSWSKKDIRGRKGTFDYSIPEAASCLMNLSCDKGRFLGRRELEDGVDGKGLSKKMKKDVGSDQKGLGLRDLELERPKDDEEEVLFELKKRLDMKRKKKPPPMKMNFVGDLERVQTIELCDPTKGKGCLVANEFRCSNCDKLFLTSQALGGHRSSCLGKAKSGNQLEEEPLLVESDSASKKKVDDPIPELEEKEAGEKQETIYQCDVCNKIFPTGQALGGHKRCHWKGVAKDLSSPGEANPRADKKSPPQASKVCLRVFAFDLNEPFLMPEGDQ